jgi:Cap4 dsDNA endonuclease
VSLDQPHHLEPADDSGSDTAARFHYQAEVMFPFCLACVFSDIECVIAEHFEDIAVRQKDRWRFIQVKSRNATLPPWTLRMLLEQGGALHALFRTHQQIRDVPASLELILEGAYNQRDAIKYLRGNVSRSEPQLVQKVGKAFGIDLENALSFLNRVTLLGVPPARAEIKSVNFRLMHEHNPMLNHQSVAAIYDKALGVIEHAMRAERVGLQWPTYTLDPTQAPPDHLRRLELKTLHKTQLEQVFKPLKPDAIPVSPTVRLTTHVAQFALNLRYHYFINITNLSAGPIEITHVWYEHDTTTIPIIMRSRRLPVRLDTNTAWCTWLPVALVPPEQRIDGFDKFKIRLSTSEVITSRREDAMPRRGEVPGGPFDPRDI